MALKDLIPWNRQETRLPVRLSDAGDHPLFSLHREVNRLVDDVFHGFGFPASKRTWRGGDWPNVELSETDKEVRVTAELPGLDEKDVEVSIDDNVLSIRGERKFETSDMARGYSERSYGRFERHISLPRGIEQDKGKASLKNGVLAIALPKSAASIKSRRTIPINAH
ncbi:Hsp20/alpha crystallin family protein [Sphingopyxis sp. 113P3]|jgi:Molecular chaperone (small heat shock protein)|uniref:Hsp20/alpha crystallin family protein n=1 Tax=Sphingopyxis sp. (strain 113P3) TaxID=292913 RepID=UPI0006AD4D69|nr:Hsp20/alpha crystallin family protein [Sphingopyxis sp. 113P3]ALC12364.1 heat-shock protein [Sphingopyxis sp. 113P3]